MMSTQLLLFNQNRSQEVLSMGKHIIGEEGLATGAAAGGVLGGVTRLLLGIGALAISL